MSSQRRRSSSRRSANTRRSQALSGRSGLRRSRWPGSRTRMNKISCSGYGFPPEIIQQAILVLPPVQPEPARRRRFIGGTRSGGVLRDGSALGESFRTDDCGRPTKAPPEASYDLASGRGLSENRRPNGLPLAAVDAEGEVLDVLVQSKRNKHAALKLMRKLLKKYALVPERLVTDDLRSCSAAVRDRTPARARAMREQSS